MDAKPRMGVKSEQGMSYTQAERDQIKRDNPDCYFLIVTGYQYQAVVAIPKPKKPLPVGGMFDAPDLLHGATIRLGARHNALS